MSDDIATCKKCKKPIKFVITKRNKRMPVEPNTIDYIIDKGGKTNILSISGEIIRGVICAPGEGTKGYIPHFSRCKAK